MQEKPLFEYAIVRIVPRVERGEFLNVGVVLYCRSEKFLDVMITLNEAKLKALFPEAELSEIRTHLQAFEQICKGSPDSGPIAKLDITSRFRWLTARRSTVVQTSEVHPGLCMDARNTLTKLHKELVLD